MLFYGAKRIGKLCLYYSPASIKDQTTALQVDVLKRAGYHLSYGGGMELHKAGVTSALNTSFAAVAAIGCEEPLHAKYEKRARTLKDERTTEH